jgi:redox-sensitive bicupin YhaK (pirin superfamily)
LGDFNQETTVSYPLNKDGNGIYVFIIEGTAEIEGQRLQKRDALGVWETNSITIIAKENTRVLIIEVPMN